MNQGFPNYSKNAKLGEAGVAIVSRIISDRFGWLFKRNHQEHDFGIDGQVEIVTDQGDVTGRQFAVQIKCGSSFLKMKNEWGYIYRGEMKHLNYLLNYPLPVFICLCNPDTDECNWVHFTPEATDRTKSGWKITVPFVNKLTKTKILIEKIAGSAVDGVAALDEYWRLNRFIAQSSIIIYVLDVSDIRTQEVEHVRAFFDRMRSTQELASKCRSKVEFMFSGFDDDSRELFEIPEVRAYVHELDQALPDLLFFIRSELPTHTLFLLALCFTDVELLDEAVAGRKTRLVSFETQPIAEFIMRHCSALNELTEWLGMSPEAEKEMFYAIVNLFPPPVNEEVDEV